MERVLLGLFAVLLVACGASASSPATAPVTPVAEAPATTLDEALARAGLTRAEVPMVSRTMTSDMGAALRAEGDRVTVIEQAGWSGSPTIFARRQDGSIVIVSPQVNVVADRHVAGGCRGFAGGRMWSEEVEYALPPGSTYAGVVSVSYDQHTEVIDYTEAEADGSPCPRPAMD